MKEIRAAYRKILLVPIAFTVLGWSQNGSLSPARSWDLSKDADYAARTAKQLKTLRLETPQIVFLDDETLAVTYADGDGANFETGAILRVSPMEKYTPGVPQLSKIFTREQSEAPLYTFHALILDSSQGLETAKHLEWPAVREGSQFLPVSHNRFVVRVDNSLMFYSEDLSLVKKKEFDYQGKKVLAAGEEFVGEYYAARVSPTGNTLVLCHSVRSKHSGGVQLAWYDMNSFDQVGQSEVSRAAGCRLGFTVTDQAAFSGLFVVHRGVSSWQSLNQVCGDCTHNRFFDVLDNNHLLIPGKEYRVFDLEGHQLYETSHESGVRVGKPDPWSPMPHAANAPRFAYDDGQPKDEPDGGWSRRIHVVDWKEGHEVAVIKVSQKHLPALHDGGMQLERGNLTDLFYALSPNGKKLAVLSMNSLAIYELQ